ncbi:DUF4381 domain-containing protein [Vibrio sp. DNB22_10_4]
MGNSTQGQIVEFGSHLVKRAEWISPPQAISWFPQTLMWQLIGLATITVVFGYIAHRYHQYLKRTYLREAWALFQQYDYEQNIAAIAHLMKQLAHQHWPKSNVGTMTNHEFAQFICQSSATTLHSVQVSQLMESSYRASPNLTAGDRQAIKQWFKEVTC